MENVENFRLASPEGMVESTIGEKKMAESDIRVGVLTSGGDAPGMNAAVRAVVRGCLKLGVQPYAIFEGWQGAVDGGEMIKAMQWADVGSILNRGGTVIGTARCAEFREYAGRKKAALNLIKNGISKLVVIGGDGSLSGTNEIREEWPKLVAELFSEGAITEAEKQRCAHLAVVGLVGSIDNDLVGFDMTIGADSALHRILTAIDELSSTAASHRRTFVVEVMGRRCGYLPLMGAVAGSCDYVFIPEKPPAAGWQERLADRLKKGRQAGRRESIVLVAEGAVDQEGNQISAQNVCDALEEHLGEQPRVTILGHVQRGGTPSAYDRWMPTILGFAAVQEVLEQRPEDPAVIIGAKNNRVGRVNLVEAVNNTRQVGTFMKEKNYQQALAARGPGFANMLAINRFITSPPKTEKPAEDAPRVAIINAGGLAPGMNAAAMAVTRLGIGKGYQMLGVKGSFNGLIEGNIRPLDWEAVEGWNLDGGAVLGTRRDIPTVEQYYSIGRSLEKHKIDALVVIGGYNAYEAVYQMRQESLRYPAFQIPMVCIPASIDNNLPGSELSIGADTALNNALWALDRIKESAAASKRCYVADTMGRHCGYLALMAGIASGAELVYLDEFPVTLHTLSENVKSICASFDRGRGLCLVLRNEKAGGVYNREFMARIFDHESGGRFDVRHSALGHIQQGGEPTPYDRILATRLADGALKDIEQQLADGSNEIHGVGMGETGLTIIDLMDLPKLVDVKKRRPKQQWWLDMLNLVSLIAWEDYQGVVPKLTIDTL